MAGQNTGQKNFRWSTKAEVVLPFVIFFLVLAVFSPAIGYGFFNMDDLPLIERKRLLLNHGLTDFQAIFSDKLWTPYYKPLVYLTWMIEKELFGLKPGILHMNNILLHGINAVLAFLLAKRILPSFTSRGNLTLLAGSIALLWAIHPLRTESVVWAVERKDVLFGMFFFLACHAWINVLQDKGKQWILFTTLFYGLSCLSKSMAITFPAVAFLLAYYVKPAKRISPLPCLPLLLTLVLMLFLYGYLTPERGAIVSDPLKEAAAIEGILLQFPPVLQHGVIACTRFCFLLLHAVFPFRLAIVYPREWILESIDTWVMLFPVLTIALCILILLPRNRQSVLAFAVAWFGIAVSPILTGEGVGTNFLSDRYTYLPAFGITVGLVCAIHSFLQGKQRQFLLSISILVLLNSVLTILQTRQWKTNLTLWEQAIENYPQNWYALYNRAKLISFSDPNQALADLQSAIAVMPGKEELQYARGVIYQQASNHAAALEDFTHVLAKKPGHYEALLNRGNVHRAMKNPEAAIQDYSDAIAIRPRFWKAWNNRGLVYADLGNDSEALKNYNQAIAGDPNYPQPYLNRAYLRMRPDGADYNAALADFDAYLKFVPDSHEALFRRGYAYFRTGNLQAALADMNNAIRLHPNEGFYYVGRSQVYDAMGNAAGAAEDRRRAETLGRRAG